MNILTHPVHTGYQFDLAGTGNEFYSLDMLDTGEVFWDEKARPMVKNFHRLRNLDEAPVQFDLALVHYDPGFELLKELKLPIIFKEHCLRQPFQPPESWVEKIAYYSFASNAAATRWLLPESANHRKVIIGMGLNVPNGGARRKSKPMILSVGQNISTRGEEKGRENLKTLAQHFPITVVGKGNDGIPGSVGPARNYQELQQIYGKHRIYLNPSHVLTHSTLEAMAAGMAVVSFATINSDLIQHGINGLVVENLKDAESTLKRVLKNWILVKTLGIEARRTIRERFSPKLFQARWNALFRQAAYEFNAHSQAKPWQRFDIENKLDSIRIAARKLILGQFEYCRVGHDARPMTFLSSGWVGEGRRACEVFWDIKHEKKAEFLEISSGTSLTCRLKRCDEKTWKGRWLQYEKMPIVLRRLE